MTDRRSPRTSSEDNRDPDPEKPLRRPKTRKPGGFLLPSALRFSPEPEDPRTENNDKGKKKADSKRTPHKLLPYNRAGVRASIRSSPLSQVESTVPTDGEDGPAATQSHVRDYGRDSSDNGEEAAQPASAIDPAQIVSMALNLSESRRRNFSAGHLLPPPSPNPRRVTSAAQHAANTAKLQGSYQGQSAGGNLRHHLQHQRQPRNVSPENRRHGVSRHSSNAYPTPGFLDSAGSARAVPDFQYHFSAATLARAEKARQAIELSLEFRRLLQYLPQLKPDHSAPGNFLLATSSVPGTAGVDLSRTLSSSSYRHDLGRTYNPLQLIRNRKLRARTRNPLNPDIDYWEDSARVREWVDAVEDAARRPGYRGDDTVILPPYPVDGEIIRADEGPVRGHRRNEGSISKPKRPRMDWFTCPSELLADAYWLEQGHNKALIEDKAGARIFPQKRSLESLRPRASHESRRSHSGSVHLSTGSVDDETDPEAHAQRGRIRPLGTHSRDNSRGIKGVFHRARARSRSADALSSSDEGSNATGRRHRLSDDEAQALDPLEKRLTNFLAGTAAASGAGAHQDGSPLLSPGTPNKWGADLHDGAVRPERSPARIGIVEPPGDDASAPGSPAEARQLTPPSRRISPVRKKLPKLPFIRTDGDDTDGSSRHPSGESPQPLPATRTSLDLPGRKLFPTRTNDSLSSLPRVPKSKSKEPQSAVRRFFKGSAAAMRGKRAKPTPSRSTTGTESEGDEPEGLKPLPLPHAPSRTPSTAADTEGPGSPAQPALTAPGKPDRFARLAPPGLDLSHVSGGDDRRPSAPRPRRIAKHIAALVYPALEHQRREAGAGEWEWG
ncbi:hypothetical protein EJ06DRAFT_519751 [Trichodelitschia bisporula]|uniref:Uncharacterized protein n=1 Tax=Trichodelitschia bisporula TaxID=703511 RepID=A0A6G1I3S2_9PEZI|nr:hypothetical protein EJ06DRAFT_519751 [Trichodelitschia bisporula]